MLALVMGTLVNGLTAFFIPMEAAEGWGRSGIAAINSFGLLGLAVGSGKDAAGTSFPRLLKTTRQDGSGAPAIGRSSIHFRCSGSFATWQVAMGCAFAIRAPISTMTPATAIARVTAARVPRT